jgi:hypothetical protein
MREDEKLSRLIGNVAGYAILGKSDTLRTGDGRLIASDPVVDRALAGTSQPRVNALMPCPFQGPSLERFRRDFLSR